MSEIKDYGEPWSYNKDRTATMERTRPAYQDRDGKQVPGKSTYADDGAVRDRALACVNALAGRDPEKLDGFVKSAGPIRDWIMRMRDDVDGATVLQIDAFTDALADFEGGEK